MNKMTASQNMQLSEFFHAKIEKKETKAEEDQKVMDLLGRFTAQMLMDGIRDGHPKPEWGDGETWRFYYIDECKLRGLRLLEQLNWPSNEKALYVNLYTGSVKTLIDIATTDGYLYEYTIAEEVWSVVEHWEPYDESEHLKSGKQ